MNLLVTGAFGCTDGQLNTIKTLGHNIVFMQYEKDEMPCDYSWVEGIIGNGIFLHHPIEKFPSLKFIQLTSAGFDRVDLNYVKENNISIHNAKGVYSIPMAEFALSGVLSLYKQLNFFRSNQKAHRWEKHRDIIELYGKNVLIVGAGNVGAECAKRFALMGCSVYGADVYPQKTEHFVDVLPMSKLDGLLGNADVVILTLPLTGETKGLFNISRFEKFKDGAILVNISRGAVVNQADLVSALDGKLGGAVLDVFDNEPLEENSPLWEMENVIITPHNSFVGEGNIERLYEVVLSNLKNF